MLQAATMIACDGHANLMPTLGWYVESRQDATGVEFRTILTMELRDVR